MRIGHAHHAIAALALALSACGGGDGGSSGSGGGAPTPTPTPTAAPTAVYTAPAQEALTTADVQRILAQSVGEAQARGLPSVIAVTDRVGNVLAVFRMTGARATMITSRLTATGVINDPAVDAQGLEVPAAMGAIAKAITGAYLSSAGNAFSTRTASMIVQQKFPPAPSTTGLESGPLFGVQFSQLPCSDLNTRFGAGGLADALIGPKRSPLGLAADAGGFPLYKNGVVVGGIGVMGDGDYGFDPNVLDRDDDAEEAIALAGTQGFAAPDAITADKIPVDGTSLRYTDARRRNAAPAANQLRGDRWRGRATVAVKGYSDGAILAGAAYGATASGYRAATGAEFAEPDAFVLTDGAGNNRYPVRAGDRRRRRHPAADRRRSAHDPGGSLPRDAPRPRPDPPPARQPRASDDQRGRYLWRGAGPRPLARCAGVRHRRRLQKARTVGVLLERNAGAATARRSRYRCAALRGAHAHLLQRSRRADRQARLRRRAIGNLSRPYFPDGEVARAHGPFSREAELQPLRHGTASGADQGQSGPARAVRGRAPGRPTPRSVHRRARRAGRAAPACQRHPDLPRRVPIYRGNTLVGAIGVSGDGIDQDDMISFLGLNAAGLRKAALSAMPRPRSAPIRWSSRSAAGCACAMSVAPSRRSSIAATRTSARGCDGACGTIFRFTWVCPDDGLALLLAVAGRQPAAESAPDAETGERPVMLPPGEEPAPEDVDPGLLDGRRRPGYEGDLPERAVQDNPGALRAPPPEAFPVDQIPIPDRWRLIESLGVVKERWFDPYHQNTYKGDRPIDRAKVPWLPIKGDDWFFSANVVSDSVIEPRTFPIPWACRPPAPAEPGRVRQGRQLHPVRKPSSPARR
jgi:uncharacterized protein GlcG (DUF336 family)